MASYTVHIPNDGSDGFSRASRSAFVRDGFSWAAFLFGPLYLLRHRAVVAAAVWVIGVLALVGLGHLLAFPAALGAAFALLVMLFTGLEASSLQRAALAARGFDLVDIAEGGREQAERSYFRRAIGDGLPARRTVPVRGAGSGGGVIGYDDPEPPR